MGDIKDTSDVYVLSDDGGYHWWNCSKVLFDDDAEPVGKIPEDAELEDCCSE